MCWRICVSVRSLAKAKTSSYGVEVIPFGWRKNMVCPSLVEFENKAAAATDIFPELPCSKLNSQLMLVNGPQRIC
jgi:hypothetical protein